MVLRPVFRGARNCYDARRLSRAHDIRARFPGWGTYLGLTRAYVAPSRPAKERAATIKGTWTVSRG
jgi:hypothetical protein